MSSDTTPRSDVDPHLRSQMRLYVVLLLSVVLCTQLQLPFRLAGLLFGTATIWVGALVLIHLFRLSRQGIRPRGQIAVSLGIGLTGMLLTVLLRDAALYPVISEHERCLGEAQTNTARQVCEDDRVQRLENMLDRLRPSQR